MDSGGKKAAAPGSSKGPPTPALYKKYLRHNEDTLTTALKQYTEYKAEYQELQNTLQTLADEPHYDAMVPVGPLAFFPGHLIHTNEILVLLGENLFAERSAKQAAAIARRREQYADEKIAELNTQLSALVNDQTHLVRKELEENMYNEEGDKIVDIKEEVGEGEMAFGEEQPADDGPDESKDDAGDSGGLRAKRERAMGADAVALDRSKLSAEERRFLETIERFTDDDEDDDEDQDEVDDQSELEDDGDAFSDEDRANAARDDDEDDYNDSDYDRSDDGDDDGPPTRSTVVERVFESQPPSSQPAAPSPQQPKSILKQKPASSLFKRRLAEQKHPDDDDSAGPTRSVRFDASANTTHTLPRQDAAAESAVQQAADLMGELQVEDRAAKKHAPLVFKPNVAAVSRVRSQPPNNAAHPMKRAVVERDSAAMTELPTLESVDDDLHAKEIVQAYARMRHARLATGKLDGAAEIAERVLGATPGVTLVDRAGGQGSGAPEDADDQGFERIELAGDPSPLNMAHAAPHPPEVVHQDAPRPKMSRFKAKRLGLEE